MVIGRILWRRKILIASLLVVGIGYWAVSNFAFRSTVNEASPLAQAARPPSSQPAGQPALGQATGGQASQPAASQPSTGQPAAASQPAASQPATGGSQPAAAANAPKLVQAGQWKGADASHRAAGTAQIIQTAPGKFILRVESFSVTNGPDLFLVLSPKADGYADGSLSLGKLKGTDGAFNYEIPDGTDLSKFKSAVVWCKAFNFTFGSATLSPA